MFGILILDRSPLYKHFEDTTLDVVLLLQAKDPLTTMSVNGQTCTGSRAIERHWQTIVKGRHPFRD
jgi:hypothetical protein